MTAPDMAAPEVGMRALILSEPAIAAVVAERVYVDVAAQNHDRPAIVVIQVSRRGVQSVQGPTGLAEFRIDCEVIADRAEDIRYLRNQLRLLLDGFSGPGGGQDFDNIQFGNEAGRFNAPTESRIHVLTFSCWLKEGTL